MAKLSIRVSSGVVPIEVNDAGDTIELRTDAEFMKSCIKMQQRFNKSKAAYDAVLEKENVAPEEIDTVVDSLFSDSEEAINELFGEDACTKIFAGRKNITQYAEFFDQLFSIMEAQQDEAASKYTQRKGSRR